MTLRPASAQVIPGAAGFFRDADLAFKSSNQRALIIQKNTGISPGTNQGCPGTSTRPAGLFQFTGQSSILRVETVFVSKGESSSALFITGFTQRIPLIRDSSCSLIPSTPRSSSVTAFAISSANAARISYFSRLMLRSRHFSARWGVLTGGCL